MTVVIKAEAVTRRLSGDVPVTLVENANVEIQSGEFVVIRGPSGSGKSSLLYLLGLLDVPTSGKIWVGGRETWACSEDQLADVRLEEIGFVFQSHFLLPEFTALENVMLPMQRLGRMSSLEMKKQAEELLTRLGLGSEILKFPRQLSGGQSQRVAIARALANNPILILADEPTGNLDSVSSLNVQNILRELAKEGSHAVVAVTHDTQFADRADRTINIVDGKIVEGGGH